MANKWLNEEAFKIITEYFYPRAGWLNDNCNWGTLSYTSDEANEFVNDPLMQQIEIYDCKYRRAAGFSNVIQDLWHKTNTPKWHHQDWIRQELIRSYDTSYWSLSTWLWVMMFHRNTGSGASFTRDHGYRNNIVQYFGQCLSTTEMMTITKQWQDNKQSMFTSIGNQPPAPRKGVSNIDFLLNEAPALCQRLADFLEKKQRTHKEVVDYLNEYNLTEGHRRFNFTYAALSMDIGDYFPDLVDPQSHTYLGNNAKRCKDLISKGYKDDEFMDLLLEHTPDCVSYARDYEDILCDGIRFVQNYVPRSDDTYAHVPAGITNNCGFVFDVEQRNG